MPFNLLLLPLLGGYVFTHFCYVTRFRAYALTGPRILLEAAGVGTFFLVAAHVFVTTARLLLTYCPCFLKLESYWRLYAPFPYSASAIASLILAAVCILIANLIVGKGRASKWTIRRYGDELMKILQDAFYNVQPVMLTMQSGKVYVGLLDKGLGLNPQMPYISILPTLSGYRDKETLKVQFTVNYSTAYREIVGEKANYAIADAESMRVIVPTQTLCSARLFDEDLYASVFARTKPQARARRRRTKAGETASVA